jgi:L-lactate dehydrogenase complex protein LldE
MIANIKSKVGLFIPCYIDQFYPQVGIATLELLIKLGLDIDYPLKQTCCGQPLANGGSEKEAKGIYLNFVNNFSEFDYIVSPSGSCVYHVREHYNILEQTEEVIKVRKNTFELCEFITDILKIEDLKIYFPHKVGIHQSCHGLRGLKLGVSSELVAARNSKVYRLLEKAEGIELIKSDREDECCGFGGTFAIFEPDVSVKMGKERILDHERNGTEVITATDSSCLMHLEGIARRNNNKIQFMHVAEILNQSRL